MRICMYKKIIIKTKKKKKCYFHSLFLHFFFFTWNANYKGLWSILTLSALKVIYIYKKKKKKKATKEILSWCREHRLTISHSREWTLLPSLTSESGRPDTAVALTPGTETTFSVLPLLVTHQITLCSPLPSSFPSSSCIPLLPSVWPFTPPASSSFTTRRRSLSSPSRSLALPGK